MKSKRRSFWAKVARTLVVLSIALTVLWHVGRASAQAPLTYNTLDSWSFEDASHWTSDYGYFPIMFTNIVNLPGGGFGNSLLLDTNITAYLNYNIVETDGTTNLMLNQGTILFWFSPDWSSTNGGVGPGQWGRFIEAGSYTSDASFGWWSIYTSPGGTNIYFSGQTNNGSGASYLSYPIAWASNDWHSIALTYSPSNSTLYLDGVPVVNGFGVAYYPGTNVLANGFWIGSDSNGTNQARGMFGDIMTLDQPVSSNIIASLVTAPSLGYEGGVAFDPIPNAPSNPQIVPPTYDAIVGGGNLTNFTSASSCVNGTNAYNVWITNVVAIKVVTGTNLTMNLTFSIEGGAPGVPYDVFVSSILNNTNTVTWAWEGQGFQCTNYTLVNLPAAACYLILGTPQDTDDDGLTDAYERLVSHTNPYSVETAGDGISDLEKVLAGVNPDAVYPAIPPGFSPQTCPQ